MIWPLSFDTRPKGREVYRYAPEIPTPGDKDLGLSLPVLFIQILQEASPPNYSWACPCVRPGVCGQWTVSTKAADRLTVNTLTRLRAGILLPRINKETDLLSLASE